MPGIQAGRAVVAHVFSSGTGESGRLISEVKVSLVYTVSSKTTRATQRNPVLKNNSNKQGREEALAWFPAEQKSV